MPYPLRATLSADATPGATARQAAAAKSGAAFR
jgi:hypothetical protein